MKIVVWVKQVSVLADEVELTPDGDDVDPAYVDHAVNKWDVYAAHDLRPRGAGGCATSPASSYRRPGAAGAGGRGGDREGARSLRSEPAGSRRGRPGRRRARGVREQRLRGGTHGPDRRAAAQSDAARLHGQLDRLRTRGCGEAQARVRERRLRSGAQGRRGRGRALLLRREGVRRGRLPGRRGRDPAPAPDCLAAAEGTGSAVVSTFAAPAAASRARHREFLEAPAADIDITTADFLLSIGRGIGERENIAVFEALAERMGATLSVSRPLVDGGWMPSARQVGQSEKTVKPKVYLALGGISGAVQHVAGMKTAETIIAVNSDPEAAIFNVAHYGAVADIFDVAELQKLLEARDEDLRGS